MPKCPSLTSAPPQLSNLSFSHSLCEPQRPAELFTVGTSRPFLFFVTRALHAVRQASTLEQLALPGCPDFPQGYLFSKTRLSGLLAGLPIVGWFITPEVSRVKSVYGVYTQKARRD